MLTVEMTSMPASSSVVDVLPALGVPRARDVGVRELVDEGDLGPAREDGVEVHLLEASRRGAPACGAARPRGRRPSPRCAGGRGVSTNADDDVGAALDATVPSPSMA